MQKHQLQSDWSCFKFVPLLFLLVEEILDSMELSTFLSSPSLNSAKVYSISSEMPFGQFNFTIKAKNCITFKRTKKKKKKELAVNIVK